MNFNELAEYQKKLRSESDGYAMFIELDAVTLEESYKLWDWYMENSLDVDRDGKIRKKLLYRYRLDPDFVKKSLIKRVGGRTRVVPDKLKSIIDRFLGFESKR